MVLPNLRFVEFVAKCTAALGLPKATIRNDSYQFQVGDRWVELKYDAARGTVTTAAVACTFPSPEAMRADLVSSFNLRQLFDGGHLFVADETCGVIRLCRTDRLSELRPETIRQDLVAFSRRTAMAGTWYLRAGETQDDAAPAPAPVHLAAVWPDGP